MENNIIKNDQSPLSLKSPPILNITAMVIEEIFKSVGLRQAETGGVLGGNDGDDSVAYYHFDRSSRNSGATYSPNHVRLNRLFKNDWNPKSIRLKGFVHSHPGWLSRPSHGDEIYAKRILQAIEDLGLLWLPIVNTVPNTGGFKLTPWAACLVDDNVEIVKTKIKVLSETQDISRLNEVDLLLAGQLNKVLDNIVIHPPIPQMTPAGVGTADISTTSNTDDSLDHSQIFERVQNAYDLEIMRTSRIICVGAGGAASWIEELARAGIGQFVLIDPDTVSQTNIATQQTYLSDIGRPKVDCIANRIRLINPSAKVVAIQKYLDDLSDEEMEHYVKDEIDGVSPRQTIICGLSDNFFAQARVNRLALHFGIPSLSAQVYLEGRGAELTFTYPGITPACSRCILSSRFDYYLKQEKENTVTSHGTPIFSTTRLNAIKGFLTLAILHHGSDHPRWGKMLERIGNRSLIQVRIDPDFSQTIGIPVFDRVFKKADKERLFFDETVWLPQKQECPETGYDPCPDCGGTGNLLDSIGVFEDTRVMPLSPSPKIEEKKIAGMATSHHRQAA